MGKSVQSKQQDRDDDDDDDVNCVNLLSEKKLCACVCNATPNVM